MHSIRLLKNSPYNYIFNTRILSTHKVWNSQEKLIRKYVISKYLSHNIFGLRYSLTSFYFFKSKSRTITKLNKNLPLISNFWFSNISGLKTMDAIKEVNIKKQLLSNKFIILRNYFYISNFLVNKQYLYSMYTESIRFKYYLYYNKILNSNNYNWFLWYTVAELYKKKLFRQLNFNSIIYNLLKYKFLKFNIISYFGFLFDFISYNINYQNLIQHKFFFDNQNHYNKNKYYIENIKNPGILTLCYFYKINKIKVNILVYYLWRYVILKNKIKV